MGRGGTLATLDRGAEAVSLIDDCLRRAKGQVLHPNLLQSVVDIRFRHFEKSKDAAGCRATAEIGERLGRTDANSLYYAACYRAVTAAVIRATGKSEDNDKQAAAEADQAMTWLKRAVAAGYKNAKDLKEDKDLAPARPRGLQDPARRGRGRQAEGQKVARLPVTYFQSHSS